MFYIIKNVVSIIEWVTLLSLPVILLGYFYRNYIKRIIIIALIMSLFAVVIRYAPFPMAVIIALQILLLMALVKKIFQVNYLEMFVITGVGYGFYIFIQLLIAEMMMSLSNFSYFDIIFSNLFLPVILQIITIIITVSLCYLLSKYTYYLDELRVHLREPNLTKRLRNIIITLSVLTYVFICLVAVVLLEGELVIRDTLVLLCIIVIFIIMSGYHILYTQFQTKRLMEAKKIFLDQDQQASTIIEKLVREKEVRNNAILKLTEKDNSIQSIKAFIEKGQNYTASPAWTTKNDLRKGLEGLDELLYALLINKRRLARLFGIIIFVSADIKSDNSRITLRQIKYLNIIMDELLFVLYQSAPSVNKKIAFHIGISEQKMEFLITCDVDAQTSPNLKIIDAITLFKQDNAKIDYELNPVKLSIICSFF
ncbi:hypothetical protein [Salipaludibacillus sp. CF4.18]|uniref:hypothetical protein n=1 Tax=Salipaludibacillus sp. CF4.18 TaxID=3373081 RepID=UPI003EE53529